MRRLGKAVSLGLVGGIIYILLEVLWRGYTHWSMFVVGGLCFLLIGAINEVFPWGMPLPLQMALAALLVTGVELVAGLLLNVWLGLNVWDYSGRFLNLWGQICPRATGLWFALSLPGILLDDLLRWKWFGEEKPRYRIL